MYGYEGLIYPLRITKNKLEKHAKLFYMKNDENDHYCWIKNINSLIRSQINNNQIFLCDR